MDLSKLSDVVKNDVVEKLSMICLVTKSALAEVENKIPNVSTLVLQKL